MLATLAEALAILALGRVIGLIQMRLGGEAAALQTSAGLTIGAIAPAIVGYELHAREPRTLAMNAGRWGVVFLSPSCSVCRNVARDITRVDRASGSGATMVLVSRGTNEQNDMYSRVPSRVVAFGDPNGDIHGSYEVDEVPYGFLVVDGHIRAKGGVNDGDQLEMLLEGRSRKTDEAIWTPALDAATQEGGHGP
ncbi:MAG: hypothetical protein M3Z65_00765 [Chloroflexota bacterium]|nr:hypothetical protein [Chloroflexota bacterium]